MPEMTLDVRHDAPSQRRHYRISAPICVEIGGMPYQTVDWSLSGFRIANYNGHIKPGDTVHISVQIPFSGFHINFECNARVVWTDPYNKTLAGEFQELNERELQVLKTFARGLMNGEMAEVNNLIRRLDVPVTPASLKPDQPKTAVQQRQDETRRKFGMSIYTIAGFFLTLALVIVIYTNLFQMRVDSAVMTSPTDLLLAPTAGQVFYITSAGDEIISSGEPLMGFVDPKLEREIQLAELRVQEASIGMAKTDENGNSSEEWKSAMDIVRSLENNLMVRKDAVTRSEQLLNEGYITQAVHEETLDEYYKIEKQLNEAKQKANRLKEKLSDAEQRYLIAMNEYELLKQQRDRLTLRAPSDGRLIKVLVAENSAVRDGQAIGVFERAGNKQVHAFLTLEESLSVAINDEVDVYFPTWRKSVEYRVVDIDHISQSIDERRGSFTSNMGTPQNVTVKLEPVDAEAMEETRQITPGTAAVVLFDQRPFSRFFSRLFTW